MRPLPIQYGLSITTDAAITPLQGIVIENAFLSSVLHSPAGPAARFGGGDVALLGPNNRCAAA